MVVRSLDRIGYVVSMVVVVVPEDQGIHKEVVTMTILYIVWSTCPWTLRWIGGSSNESDGHRFVRQVTRFLTERSWVIVTTDKFDVTTDTCPYELHGDDDPRNWMDHSVRGLFEVVLQLIIGMEFGDSFSLCGDLNKS